MKLWHKKISTWLLLLMILAIGWSFPAMAVVTIGDENAASPLTSVYQSYSFDDDDEDDEDTKWTTTDRDRYTGPGAIQQNVGEDTLSSRNQGPVVEEVLLDEIYHEDYQVYELSMENLFFLYSNVSNGGITDKPVYVEIPTNLVYSMEKDGMPLAYQSGQHVGERGTYVMRITGVYDPEVPLSEQQEYRATFRFRIQEKPPETADSGELPDVYVEWETQSQEEETEEEMDSLDAIPSINDMIGGTGEDEAEEEAQTEEDVESVETTNLEGVAHLQEYLPERGMYLNTYGSGPIFYSSVPEGMISAEPVSLEFLEGQDIRLFRNDEPVEYVPGDGVAQDGVYRLEVDAEQYFFSIGTVVGGLEMYRAPLGMTLREADRNGEPLEIREDKYAFMEQDGQYRFLTEGEAGEVYEVFLERDTQAPQVSVQVNGGRAQILYGEEQPTRVTLARNGEQLERFSLYEVEDPGRYELTAYDAAGNATTAVFQLEYHLNTFAVLSVIALIVIVAGGAVYLVKVKKSMKIR